MTDVLSAPREVRDKALDLPTAPGAYVLAIHLKRSVPLAMAGRKAGTLPPGSYLYCGSARGPGGLRARVLRHLRRKKTIRWHVDQLTTRGRVTAVWIFAGGNECELAGRLSALPAPIPGFGSSDCARCISHLLLWPEGVVLPLGPAHWQVANTSAE